MNQREKKQNRLAKASSPYLLQHAHNPVDWFEWGSEALDRARQEDKPIFLSIGYSSCHWCHVMAHESFENPEIAGILNEHFVNIKVDREERPDIDEIYMSAVQLMTGSGGWPMSVWLTPQLQPFYGGTYFPADDRYGRPGFKHTLLSIAEIWQKKRQEILASSEEISHAIVNTAQIKPGDFVLNEKILHKAFQASSRSFDERFGGFGDSPKFPQAMQLSFLTRYSQRSKDNRAIEMVDKTLTQMAFGGIFDHLGGGFHRYSTDAHWLAPHFEKMLYDQALLVRAYAEAYQLTGKPLYAQIVRETLDYVANKMTLPEGGFFSAEDADSEGVEGKFYVWDKDEIERILGNESRLFSDVFGISSQGNWQGTNILYMRRELSFIAKENRMTEQELEKKIGELKHKLNIEREKRARPFLDDKILADWNGLMISAFVYGYKILQEKSYLHAAEKAAGFIHNSMWQSGELFHGFRNGQTIRHSFSSDYAFLISGLLDLYEITFKHEWLKWAFELMDKVQQIFGDEDGGYFFSKKEDSLIARTKNPFDNASPSANSMMVRNLMRFYEMTGNEDFRDKAEKTLNNFAGQLVNYPTAYSEMLMGLDYFLGPSRQIVIAGAKNTAEYQKMLQEIHKRFLPRTVVLSDDSPEMLPVTRDKKSANGKTTVYICENFSCRLPVFRIEDLDRAFNLSLPD